MKRFGLKLWSTNDFYVNTARDLYEKQIYDYIELYAIPETYNNIKIWKELDIPYIIHAPHFVHGINFSIKDKKNENIKLAETAFRFADELYAEKIIFHPGIKGDYKETAKQMRELRDPRIIVENKPYNVAVKLQGLDTYDICVGYSREQIQYILDETGFGFCLDIGHGICAANSLQIDYIHFLKDFIELNPIMYHISDGDSKSTIDKHLNIGKGNFDFKSIFQLIPETAFMSVETYKASKENLDDFVEDIKTLKLFI